MSAVSNMLTPESRQRSTRRVASLASVVPHALKNSLEPPKVAAPKLNAGTFIPDLPSCLNSICHFPKLRFSIITAWLLDFEDLHDLSIVFIMTPNVLPRIGWWHEPFPVSCKTGTRM